MRFTTTIVALFLALSATANAEVKAEGAYVGASVGVAKYSASGEIDGLGTDGKEGVAGLFGGYKFMRHLAIEGRYVDLGKNTLKDDGAGVGNADFSVVTLNIVGLLPLGDSNWELMGQVGAGYGYYTFEFYDDGQLLKGNQITPSIGIGARWTPTPKITLQISADRYKFSAKEDGGKISNKFGVAQFGAQYNF
ncbi:MAG: porin family protein [Gammaproteobacteria bacterium]|nr:porin family protein [Gammaproteobacteria bacterium]